MSANVKKVVTWAIVGFAAFYLFTQPQDSANVVTGALGLLQQAADAVVTFFQSLAN
jgi:hypothetical protein